MFEYYHPHSGRSTAKHDLLGLKMAALSVLRFLTTSRVFPNIFMDEEKVMLISLKKAAPQPGEKSRTLFSVFLCLTACLFFVSAMEGRAGLYEE